jgi:hypothetical protein
MNAKASRIRERAPAEPREHQQFLIKSRGKRPTCFWHVYDLAQISGGLGGVLSWLFETTEEYFFQ